MATSLQMVVLGLTVLALGSLFNLLAMCLPYWGAYRQEDGHWGLWISCKQGICTYEAAFQGDWFSAFRAFWTAGTLMCLACVAMWFTIRLNTLFQGLLGLPFLPIFASCSFLFLLVALVIVVAKCTFVHAEDTRASYSFFLGVVGSFLVLLAALFASCEAAAETRQNKRYDDGEP